MSIVHKGDRIALRKERTRGRRVAGVFLVVIGLLFGAVELFAYFSELLHPIYIVGGFGAILVFVGTIRILRVGPDDYVAFERPQMYVDGTDYDLSLDVACVVLTECVRQVKAAPSGSTKIRYLQVFAVLADDHQSVAETCRRLSDGELDEGLQGTDLAGDLPEEVVESLDARSRAVLYRLLQVGGAELVFVCEESDREQLTVNQLGETIARHAQCPIVDVHGDDVAVTEAEELGLSLVWRLAGEDAEVEDPGPSPEGLRQESTTDVELVIWNPDDHTDSFIPSLGRRGGEHRLEYDGHRIRYRTTIIWGVDRELAVDAITDIRRRREPQAGTVIRRKPETELVILTERAQLLLELPKEGAAWLEAKLRFWLANPDKVGCAGPKESTDETDDIDSMESSS